MYLSLGDCALGVGDCSLLVAALAEAALAKAALAEATENEAAGNNNNKDGDHLLFQRYALCHHPLSQHCSCCAEISLYKLVYGIRCYLYDLHPTVLGSLPAIALAHSQFHVALS